MPTISVVDAISIGRFGDPLMALKFASERMASQGQQPAGEPPAPAMPNTGLPKPPGAPPVPGGNTGTVPGVGNVSVAGQVKERGYRGVLH